MDLPESRFFSLLFQGEDEQVKAMINDGFDINTKYYAAGGDTPLVWAVIMGNLELVKWLVDNGADLDCRRSTTEQTLLHLATRRGLNDVILYLIEKKPQMVDQLDHMDRTPGQTLFFCKAAKTLGEETRKLLKVPDEPYEGMTAPDPFWNVEQ